MAVALDVASSAQSTGSGATLSWTHTPVGTPTAVGVGVSVDKFPSATISGVTYGGVSMTIENQTVSGEARAAIFGLANPTSGAQTVEITTSVAVDGIVGGAISVTGSDTTQCFSANAIASGFNTVQTVDVASSASELVMDVVSLDLNSALTFDGSQTERWNRTPEGFLRGACSTETGSATTTMSSSTGVNVNFAMVAASFKVAAASHPMFRGS